MRDQQQLLTMLLVITEEIIEQAKEIYPNMNDNVPEQLEHVQTLVEKRESVLKQLDAFLQQQEFIWNEGDQERIGKLKSLEQTLQLEMNSLYQAFSKQMHRIHETKNVSKKYIAAYQNMAMDGSFIDKRK